MKEINPNDIKDNAIELIGKEWMLVGAGDPAKFNIMTASWGGIGVLWGRPVVFVFIRPERYTRIFMDAKNEFTLSFLGADYRDVYTICGSKSGRYVNKVEVTGLTPLFTDKGNPLFEESRLSLECKTLYRSTIEESKFLDPTVFSRWYNDKNGKEHIVYIAEILKAWEK